VTHLRKMMLEELEHRNYAASTTRAYLRAVDEFARYFNRPPDQGAPAPVVTASYLSYDVEQICRSTWASSSRLSFWRLCGLEKKPTVYRSGTKLKHERADALA
jgi:hypothetical protein